VTPAGAHHRDARATSGLRPPGAKAAGVPQLPRAARFQRQSRSAGAALRTAARRARSAGSWSEFPPKTCSHPAVTVGKPPGRLPMLRMAETWADHFSARIELRRPDAGCAPRAGLRLAESRRNHPMDAPAEVVRPQTRAVRSLAAFRPGQASKRTGPMIQTTDQG
jgi:hypothetical protein